MASGVSTQMFEWRSCNPCMAPESFLRIRRASRAVAVGRRFPMLLTQSTRFSRARIFIACILDSGSPSQSLEKHTMSRPFKAPIPVPFRFATFCTLGADSPAARTWNRFRQSSSTQREYSSSLRSLLPCRWSSSSRRTAFSPNRSRASEPSASSASRTGSCSCLRNQLATGTVKPRFPGAVHSAGRRSRAACRSSHFPTPERSLTCEGSVAAHSTRRWSRKGTRSSCDVAIVILSAFTRRSSGSQTRRSSSSIRSSGGSPSVSDHSWASRWTRRWLTRLAGSPVRRAFSSSVKATETPR